jgi:hypothetical protein
VIEIELLKKEIRIQLDLLDSTVHEIVALRSDLADRAPTTRERAAAGAFLADFYGGIENLLKRISFHYGIEPPSGDNWHLDLFLRFCKPGFSGLPVLIDDDLREPLAAYRRFRHVLHHGYVIQLQWNRMVEGINGIEPVYAKFKANLLTALSEN